jgi:hypothetical protein|tara:strand:- start:545 stop:1048 length:504 start_codon:yes stop_codon:yes gene_type:complete
MPSRVEKFKTKLDNFFKWVKVTELVELEDIDVSEDPVRPELDVEWRTSYGRKIYGLKYEDEIEGIICIAYTNDVPSSVKELDLMSQNAHFKKDADTAIAYTVWSRKRGAGKEIIGKIGEMMRQNPDISKLVTLSPLTPMATHFHIRNGAKQIGINNTTQNFEYKVSE